MLAMSDAFGSFSVNDIVRAKAFYGETLGLKVKQDDKYGILEVAITTGLTFMLYPKKDHAPATYTVLNFNVADIEKAVDELTGKGVSFEKYQGELKTDEKGIFRDHDMKIAWFKDPAGNILSVIEE